MTNGQLLRLLPLLCQLAHDEDIRRALAACAAAEDEAARRDLCAALMARPDETRRLCAGVTGTDTVPDAATLAALMAGDLGGYFHLALQCSPEELTAAVCTSAVPLTPQALALLVSACRREEAQRRYALQLLWRIHGDERLPDALTLFPAAPAPARDARTILNDITRQLGQQGGPPHE